MFHQKILTFFPTVLVSPDRKLGGGGARPPSRLGGDPHVVERVGVQVLQGVGGQGGIFQTFVLRKLLN